MHVHVHVHAFVSITCYICVDMLELSRLSYISRGDRSHFLSRLQTRNTETAVSSVSLWSTLPDSIDLTFHSFLLLNFRQLLDCLFCLLTLVFLISCEFGTLKYCTCITSRGHDEMIVISLTTSSYY